MKTFSQIKSKVKKYQEDINRIELFINDETNILKKEIINYWLETKFLLVKLEDNSKEYYFISEFDILDLNYFLGIRVNEKTRKIDFGKLSFNSILKAICYETITAEKFFLKIKKLGINFDENQDPILIECNKLKPNAYHSLEDKKLVVGYCRLSKYNKNSKHGYERQICSIKNFIEKNDEYKISEFFEETISGTLELKQRKVFFDMIEYCSINDIHTVIISEFNRLGRKKDVINSALRCLIKHNINEIYVLKENLCINEEFLANKNNIRKLNALAKACEDEYDNIKYRLAEGRKSYVEKRNNALVNKNINVPVLGRRKGSVKEKDEYLKQYKREVDLLMDAKSSLRQISMITGTSLSTLQRLKKKFCV